MKKDVEDLSVQLDSCTLTIKYPDVTYSYWKGLLPYNNDFDITSILIALAELLDCSVEVAGMRVINTASYNYERYISDYYYYLLHIEDQELYNFYFDCLTRRHEDNIEFERLYSIPKVVPKCKAKTAAVKKTKGKFVRQVTTDMFTNVESYIYSNSATGETITSDDPNLLDGLNGVKPKKEKKVKSVGVPMTSMMFQFKKKTND